MQIINLYLFKLLITIQLVYKMMDDVLDYQKPTTLGLYSFRVFVDLAWTKQSVQDISLEGRRKVLHAGSAHIKCFKASSLRQMSTQQVTSSVLIGFSRADKNNSEADKESEHFEVKRQTRSSRLR